MGDNPYIVSVAHDPLCQRRFSKNHVPCVECDIIGAARADERERERARRIDRYDTTTIQEILSDEQERIVAALAGLPYPWGRTDPAFRHGWDLAMKHAARIARGGGDA